MLISLSSKIRSKIIIIIKITITKSKIICNLQLNYNVKNYAASQNWNWSEIKRIPRELN